MLYYIYCAIPTCVCIFVSQASAARQCNVLTRTCVLVELRGATKAWMPPWDKMLQRMTFCSAMLQSAAAELATIAAPPSQSWLISFLCPPASKTALEQHRTTRWDLLWAQWWMPTSMITKVLIWLSLTVHWVYCCLSDRKEPVLLLLSDQHSQSLATWQFQELLLQQINPICSHITIVFVCLCYSVLTWMFLCIPRSLKQSLLAWLGLMTFTASQMAVFTLLSSAADRRFTRISSTLIFLSFGLSTTHIQTTIYMHTKHRQQL